MESIEKGTEPMIRNLAVAAALLGLPLLSSCTAPGTPAKTAGRAQPVKESARWFLLRPEVEKAYGYARGAGSATTSRSRVP
jgi:hypothetical protein